MSSIFRKSSLDRLASPEQLDLLLEVTTPKGWLALLALWCLICAAAIWSFVGRLPTQVGGIGILVRQEGLSNINTLGAGQLTEIAVKPGDPVKKDQVVARLALPELDAEIQNSRASLAALTAQHRQLSTFGFVDSKLQAQAIEQQHRMIQEQLRTAREREALFTGRVAAQHRLVEEGLITEQVLQATRDNLLLAHAEVERGKSMLKELDVKRTEIRQQPTRENVDRELRLGELRRRIADLEEKIRTNSLVRSPAAGRVLEVRAAVGTLVGAGTPLVLIELAEGRDPGREAGGLVAILYVPGQDGKKVLPGMAVDLAPSSVRREEYGALMARVGSVSEFPTTHQAMLARLGNPELAASFIRTIENPIELRVELLRSPRTPSGYRWTSPQGPPQPIQPGTLCTASITVRLRAPIMLVMPMLREKLNL